MTIAPNHHVGFKNFIVSFSDEESPTEENGAMGVNDLWC
jgi:hypothetical protein